MSLPSRTLPAPWGRFLGALLAIATSSADMVAESASNPPARQVSVLLEQRPLVDGRAQQGLALSDEANFSSTHNTLYRFDTKWNLVKSRPIHIEGVNHLGAIHYHDGFIWAGFLNHGRTADDEYDPTQNRSIIARIDAETLEVVATWDITEDCTWIDPVCFDGTHLWVGEMHNLGIHRYRLVDGKLVRDGVLRYPPEMSFSQGVRIRGNKLYTIHTFGSMDGLFEFELPSCLTAEVQRPTRVRPIQETVMHLEGFDFVPGTKNQIWHAQGSQVDRYRLDGLDAGGGE